MASTIGGAFAAISPTDLLSAMREQFGGNAKAMAAALGLTPRAVQRYYTHGKEQRKPSVKTLDKMKRLLHGRMHVQGQFEKDSPKRRKDGTIASQADVRQRAIEIELSADDMAAIEDALRVSEDSAYEELFGVYGFIPDRVMGARYTLTFGGR